MPEKTRILIIDDEEDFCYFVKLNLEKTQEFEVLATTDAREGINLARMQKPDLVLLDICMPVMDGSEVASHLLEDERTKNIPIVFLTALVQKDEIKDESALIAGRIFIAKPIMPGELAAKIKEVLGRKNSA